MKRAIVIGATSGYGQGIAEKLINSGYSVIRLGRSSNPGLDVTNPDQVNKRFEEFEEDYENIDLVVYSAGIAIGKDKVEDKDNESFKRVFEVNTIGLLNVLKASKSLLEKSKGHFIHIGSIAHELAYVGGADYCASKSASNTIMKTIRKEWLGSYIRTTSIEIGLGNTNFQYNRYNGDQQKADKHKKGIKQIEPLDLGDFVVYINNMLPYLNLDEVVLKPIEQASHGLTVLNSKNQF